MKTLQYASIIALLLVANACKDFDDLQVDPNRATQTQPSLLLTNLEAVTFNYIDIGAALATRQLAYTDGAASEQYYNWQRSGFGRYNSMRQAVQMDKEAERLGLTNYRALALFFKSFHIIELSKVFGDVPYSAALQAANGVFAPSYDSQEDIYMQVLDDLEEANTMLDAANGSISGDIIYDGDITKWKKLINSFKLRVLLSMSLKGGTVINDVKSQFAAIVNDPTGHPIFTSNADNASLVFRDLVGNRYPFFNSNGLKTAYYMDESFVNLLKSFGDERLFVFADLTPDAVVANLAVDDFNSYGGIDGSAPVATNTNRVVAGEVSKVNPRYYDSPTNEASNLLSYAEVEFTLAEAALLGWTTGNAETHYNNGVTASFSFFGVSGAATYLNNPGVDFSLATAREQIITQKYINFFMNGGWETFYNHLRTGFPTLKQDGGGVLNSGQIPKRWMYPQDELLYNQANVEAAISSQFTADDINGVMWLLKN